MSKEQTIRTALWVTIAASAACGAQINQFDATPRHVCPGDRVELSWDVTGSGTMTVTPPIADAPRGQVLDRDTASIYPVVPARVELHVTRRFGEPTGAALDIEMIHGETLAASLADPSATCQDGVVSSTAHIRNFAPDIKAAVVAVRPDDEHTYDVMRVDAQTHQLVTAQISVTAPTTRFAALPIEGDWTLSSRLPAGNSCDPSRLPNNLVVVIYTQCSRGGQP